MRKNILMTLAVAGVATFALGACASTEGSGTTTEPQAGTNAPAETEAAAPVETEAPAAPVNPKFGETYTWEDGFQVTIGAPVAFTPSEYSMFDEAAAAHVVFDVTVVNGTAANWEPIFTTTAQSGNIEAEQIYDSENDVNGGLDTTLLPGREAVFKIGYSVANPADIVLEVSPDFEHENVIYTP
jgi:hypothetical protein